MNESMLGDKRDGGDTVFFSNSRSHLVTQSSQALSQTLVPQTSMWRFVFVVPIGSKISCPQQQPDCQLMEMVLRLIVSVFLDSFVYSSSNCNHSIHAITLPCQWYR
jgi:hypothetical protein